MTSPEENQSIEISDSSLITNRTPNRTTNELIINIYRLSDCSKIDFIIVAKGEPLYCRLSLTNNEREIDESKINEINSRLHEWLEKNQDYGGIEREDLYAWKYICEKNINLGNTSRNYNWLTNDLRISTEVFDGVVNQIIGLYGEWRDLINPVFTPQ
jgi:hypothetical protein